jgi:curved DNA-binding protein CbpA
MNYYEEFGIPRDASTAKIRQAYKTLARVLHPDAHPDEALKGMAERQMKRLNTMLETLLDPDMRRAYDASLFEAGHRRRVPPAGAGRGGVDARRYLRLCWRLQVIRERTVLAAGTRRAGGWQGLMQAALRHWFWILTGLMIAATGLWYVAGKA